MNGINSVQSEIIEPAKNVDKEIDLDDDDNKENGECLVTSRTNEKSCKLANGTIRKDTKSLGKTVKIVEPSESRSTETSCTTVSRIPCSFWQAGLRRKQDAYFSVRSWKPVSVKIDGRDKIFKVFQYVARFLGWSLAGSYRNQSLRLTNLYKSISQSRKAFRLGISLIQLEKLQRLGFVNLLLGREAKKSIEPEKDNTTSNQQCDRNPETRSIPTWKEVGTAVKSLGLFGAWTCHNLVFMCANGILDNYQLSDKERLAKRKSRQALADMRANQSYFVAALAGLFVSWWSYFKFCRETLEPAKRKEPEEETLKNLQEKQFSLFLACLKSCCDVMIFSNNAGLDLHLKWRGKKNHEVIHCLCGVISAGTVLYGHLPDDTK